MDGTLWAILKDSKAINIYRAGIKAGVWWYAVWENGRQVVGIGKTPLNEVYDQIDRGELDCPKL